MSDTVFTKVDYDVSSLVNYISLGEIGLPDIQRPFVWKNTKVRDLFDSMYKGYPVGYLLLWQNDENSRVIGDRNKQKVARLLIVDGQQRLTSLYAVVKGIKVIRENYERERIEIAFNPMEEKFEVADAAIRRDKTYIPSISTIWDDETDIFDVVEQYLSNLKSGNREITDEDEKRIKKAISRLSNLKSFPLTALELRPDIDEESVSDVFVRINSKGTPLNQADFILTIMSVFWDEGRFQLENFCRDAKKPSDGKPSPYNHFIKPSPVHLLRVAVGVAFKRGRLKYVYKILRGKDLETETFSEERRVQQFEKLKDAQDRALNLQYWHNFMNCLRQAGFRSGQMITSNNTIIASYMLYIIGRTEYNINEFDLRRLVSKWFFMTAITGRYTGSPESKIESDLTSFRDIKNEEEFLDTFNNICNVTLTNDFWNVTLPSYLATSSARSPSLFAYHAALVILDAPALFSDIKVSDLMDPSISSLKKGVEKHHLFPRNYLKKIGYPSIRDTNQIANYALVEWGENVKISDKNPADYIQKYKQRYTQEELEHMYKYHALPNEWEKLEYKEFLKLRRDLMAEIIREGYEVLINGSKTKKSHLDKIDIQNIINDGESESIEFKSTLRYNLHTGQKDTRIENSVLKTIAAFLNTNGGTLIIGIEDSGRAIGLENDKFENDDKMNLHLVNIVKSRLGVHASTFISSHFEDHENKRIFVVKCRRSTKPIYLNDGNNEKFYIRTGPSTSELSLSEMNDFIKQRFN